MLGSTSLYRKVEEFIHGTYFIEKLKLRGSEANCTVALLQSKILPSLPLNSVMASGDIETVMALE